MRIIVKGSTMVKPIAETPSGSLWLSNLDLLMPANYHTRLLFFYRFDGAANFFDAAVLKAALSRALMEFYPMAGRLTKDDNNRLAIDCNGKGALFVEAECDGAVADLGDFAPKPELSLIPAVDYARGISTFPLSLIQLTHFKCGGVCLGIANEHHLSDGPSFFHFFTTWASIARGLSTTTPPFFDRRILSARCPPQPRFSHIEYQPSPPLKTPLHNSKTSFSIFKLTRDHLDTLKAQCNEGNGLKYTTFEVVSGHVWRCLSKARGLARDQETKLHVPVDGRPRLRPPLPSGYFGNVVFSARPVASCGELVSNPLKFAVGKVHEAIARMDDDYLRSAIDYLELQGDVCAFARGPHMTKCPNLSITSWLWLPIYGVDFGWGKPVYMGTGAAPFEGKSYLMHSADNDGSLLLAITLLKEHMKLFEKLFYEAIFHAKL